MSEHLQVAVTNKMKRLVISQMILLLAFSHICAQETKFVARRNPELKNSGKHTERQIDKALGRKIEFIEEYYVLKNDENIRHGTYVRYYTSAFGRIQILESGTYQNGQKTGLWEYYHDIQSNAIKERGNYVNGKKNGVWTSYYMDTIPETIDRERFGSKRKADSVSIIINQQSAKLKMAGMYRNDKKIGEWTSFTQGGKIFQKFNFSKRRLILDQSIKDTLDYNTNRRALFVGSLA